MDMQTKDQVQSLERSDLQPAVPSLKSGEHLSRLEFEARYRAHPEIKKAELIEGVVYVASAIRIKHHSRPHFNIIGWLNLYCAATPGVNGDDNGSIRLDDENEVQPDVFLSLDPSLGGRSRLTEDDYLEGPPELIVEIAASSAAKDLSDKHDVYARHGVPEYLVIQTVQQQIKWFIWRDGSYEPQLPDERGIFRSEIFPGLWLDEAAFWAGDMKTVFEVLQQGLASPEHAAFVEQFQR